MFDIEREIKDTKVRLCLDCGKCTVVCPVAQHDPEFNPRLIAQKGVYPHGLGGSDETIWECLSCYMCVERCNYRVKFPEFIHSLRAEALAEGARLQCTHGGALQALQHLAEHRHVARRLFHRLHHSKYPGTKPESKNTLDGQHHQENGEGNAVNRPGRDARQHQQ